MAGAKPTQRGFCSEEEKRRRLSCLPCSSPPMKNDFLPFIMSESEIGNGPPGCFSDARYGTVAHNLAYFGLKNLMFC